MGKSNQTVLKYAQERNVQILEFPTIITALIAASDARKNADSAAEHMIRLLTTYGFLI